MSNFNIRRAAENVRASTTDYTPVVEMIKPSRRPDEVAFINGLPLAVVELKNVAGEDATEDPKFL